MNCLYLCVGQCFYYILRYYFLLGIDDGDEEDDEVISDATLDLRRNAVFSYVTLMSKHSLPDLLVKLTCWVVGEYMEPEDGYDVAEIVDKMYAMLCQHYSGTYVAQTVMKMMILTLQRLQY